MNRFQLLSMFFVFGSVVAGDSRVSNYHRQLLADVYQAIARAKLDTGAAAAVVNEFRQIRRNRGDVE